MAQVEQGKYRFRMLNAGMGRIYMVHLSNQAEMTVIATGGGLVEEPVSTYIVSLGAAERVDVVIDFSSYAAGTEITLMAGISSEDYLMKFVVQGTPGYVKDLPAVMNVIPPVPLEASVATREFVIDRVLAPCGNIEWLINYLKWNDITDFPTKNTVEIWNFVNVQGLPHPMHVHLVMFQIIQRQDITISANGTYVPVGDPKPPKVYERGWKDVARWACVP